MPLANYAKIGIGWTVVIAAGIYSFYISKSLIDKRRYENMKIRERMRESNSEEYEPSYRKFSTYTIEDSDFKN
ncbi:unnamed protein product [Acanthoscelides obtectus]|uniref:Uncharacterized protein n=1 Tax=Acanthoscelides obtectus TaxID=200917 RepID=A0A9P0K3T9_ACAOB|nr:unnamed protein product [Acanthoscelides obtectus]CAK1652332.1 hypothetical protein AOBTE_LOCUS17789 [Acanthoscelides obtectus]